jgi:prephenate dehydrogenase
MRIAILGLGLIGGSLARALHARGGDHEVVAWSPTGGGPARAFADGVIGRVATSIEDAIAGAVVVVVGAPAIAAVDLLRDLGGPHRSALPPDATVTDVVSTKSALLEVADAAGLRFVGGHPMAGRETSGYASSDADLFVGRPWVVVPGAAARAVDVERVESIAAAVGARVVRMIATDHDRAVAGISHLPLVLSAALVEAVAGGADGERADWPTARVLAASGWRDMTRLARGDVGMGTGIAATNAAALADRIREVRAVLDGWLADLDRTGGPDSDAIADRLRQARDRLAE